MKSTILKTTLREIRESLGRYMAILAIVALGVGFFTGLKVTKPDVYKRQVEDINQFIDRLEERDIFEQLDYTGYVWSEERGMWTLSLIHIYPDYCYIGKCEDSFQPSYGEQNSEMQNYGSTKYKCN